jgi:hypothetical protein
MGSKPQLALTRRMGIHTHGRLPPLGRHLVGPIYREDAMTERTKQRPTAGPWLTANPFLLPVEEMGNRIKGGSPRMSWLDALRYRLRRFDTTRELAAGAGPRSSEALQRRASELTRESSRLKLADSYERLLAGVVGPKPYGIAPVNWRGVAASKARINQLVKRLREDPDVRPQGAARAWVLLNDRDGALFARDDVSGFAHEVRSALALL